MYFFFASIVENISKKSLFNIFENVVTNMSNQKD